MKFKINKDEFYGAINTASRAISPNGPTQALNGLKIDVSTDEISIVGSNAVTSIEITLRADDENVNLVVDEPGTIVVDAKYLLDIVKKLDNDVVSVEIIDGTLTHFAGNKANFNINGYRPKDYPLITFVKKAITFDLDYETLVDMCGKLTFACSNRDSRPVLMGVNFSSDGSKITCVATDSYRLAKKTLPMATESFNVTVPAKSLNEIKSVFKPEDSIRVSVDNREMMFYSDGRILKTTLLEGNYPDVGHLIPTSFSNYIIVNRSVLMAAIDRATFLKTDGISVIHLDIAPGKDIILSSKSSEIGDFNEPIPAVLGNDEEMRVSFIGTYIVDALKTLETDMVRISFNTNLKPFIIRNDDTGGDQDLLQLVLPIRTYD